MLWLVPVFHLALLDYHLILKQQKLGIIVVFTGILPLCRDEEGLAAVLAHGKLFSPA